MILTARIARELLDASFFHVIVQGINKEYIFKENRFKNEYLKILKNNIKKSEIQIIAFCMMDNHAHFLLKASNIKEISSFMQKTNSVYAKYYNFMRERVGYVFKDRFLSEPILNQKYLVQCIKYIHLNPVKAGMVKECKEYKYSSYTYYTNNRDKILNKIDITNVEYNDICNSNECNKNFLDLERNINEDIENGIREFIESQNYKLYHIYENRTVLKNLVYYLKINEKIKYIKIGKYFEISQSLIKNL